MAGFCMIPFRTAYVFCLAAAAPFAALAQSASPIGPANFYVSPTGNDLNPGTDARPFATLSAARDAARRNHAKGLPPGGVTVWIHQGLYLQSQSLVLEAKDSGDPGKPVIYRAIPGEHPHIFGGTRISPASFTQVTDSSLLARMAPEARGNILAFHLPGSIPGPARYQDIFNGNGGMVQLIFNGSILPLSRWPNKGYTTMASVLDSGISPPRGGTFVFRPEVDEHAVRWMTAATRGELWLTGFWRVPFETNSIRVQSIDLAHHTITLAAPAPGGIGSKYVAMVNGTRPGDGKEKYYAFNLLEEINAPGEWSYDFHAHTIYLWPPSTPGWESGELLMANLPDSVISLNGTSNVVLDGLDVEGGLTQAVMITNGSNVLIAGCVIRDTGGGGVDIEGGKDIRVQSCDLSELGSYGIRIVAGDRTTLTPGNVVVDNNHIFDYGRQERITQAIYLDGAGNSATHNLIHDGSYNGIQYQGNDQTMAYNEIHHIGLDAGDLGAFYTNGDWAAQGNVIEYNFAHDAPSANGSNVDDGASGRKMTGNIFYGLASGIFIGGGHNNVVRNNLIVACKVGIHVDNRGVARHYDTTAQHLTRMLNTIDPDQPPWSTHYPNFLHGILDDPTEPTGNIFEDNVILRAATPYQLATPGLVNAAENLVFDGEPHFINEATRNLTLPADSPLYSAVPDFRPIPFAEIGLKLDKFRTSLPTPEETGSYTARDQTGYFDSNIDMRASDRQGRQR
jgi:hypothetical protein